MQTSLHTLMEKKTARLETSGGMLQKLISPLTPSGTWRINCKISKAQPYSASSFFLPALICITFLIHPSASFGQTCGIGMGIITASGLQTTSYQEGANMGEVLLVDIKGSDVVTSAYWCGLEFRLKNPSTGKERLGYCGLQTVDSKVISNAKTSIFSIWDHKDSAIPECSREYMAPDALPYNFDGEGTGLKTISYGAWVPNRWYTLALRRWSDEHGKTKIAYFIYDQSTLEWKHHATYVMPEADLYFTDNFSTSFMEKFDNRNTLPIFGQYRNWWKKDKVNDWISANKVTVTKSNQNNLFLNSGQQGSDVVSLNICGPTNTFTAVTYDVTAGNTKLVNNEKVPVLDEKIVIKNNRTRFTSNDDTFITTWDIDNTKAPQLSYQVEITKNNHVVYNSGVKYGPQLRSDLFELEDPAPTDLENYRVSITLTDIFNNQIATSYQVESNTPCSQNIALYPVAVWSSSNENNNLTANKAFDVDLKSRWSSKDEQDAWITVDLGKAYDICGVFIDWEKAYGGKYVLQISDDNVHWRDFISQQDHNRFSSNIYRDYYDVEHWTGRYIKMQGLETNGTKGNYSIYSFGVYGTEWRFPDGYYNIRNLSSSRGALWTDVKGTSITFDRAGLLQEQDPHTIFHVYKNKDDNMYKIVNVVTGKVVTTTERSDDSYFSLTAKEPWGNVWMQNFSISASNSIRSRFYIYSPGVGGNQRLQIYENSKNVGFENNNTSDKEQDWYFQSPNSLNIVVGRSVDGDTPPLITTDPEDLRGYEGSTVAFSVEAPDATSLQWQVNDGSGWVNQGSGSTNTIADLQLAYDGYSYRVIAHDSNRGLSDTSRTASLTVRPRFTLPLTAGQLIVSQPEDQSVYLGETAVFSVTAPAAAFYQWQVNNGTGWVNDATTSSITLPNQVSGNEGFRYRVIVTDNSGDTETSREAVLHVLPYQAASLITKQPQDQSGDAGGTVTFTVTAPASAIYQWQVNNGSGWVDLGQTASNTISSLELSSDGYKYRVVVIDPGSGSYEISREVTLHVSATVPVVSVTADNGYWTSTATDVNYIYSETLQLGPSARWQVDGTIYFYGKNIRIAPGALLSGSGKIVLMDPADNPMWEDMDAGPTTIDGNGGVAIDLNIEHRNPGGVVLADLADAGYGADGTNNSLKIGKDLLLGTDGAHVTLSSSTVGDLIFDQDATLSGYRTSRMVVSGSIVSHMVKENFTGGFVFPIGIAAGDYTPAKLTNTTANTLHVSVLDYNSSASVEAGTDGIQRTWNIFADRASGSTQVGLQHNTLTELTDFKTGSNFVTRYGASAFNTSGNSGTPSATAWQSNTALAAVKTPAVAAYTSEAAGMHDFSINSQTYTNLSTTAAAEIAYFSKASNAASPLGTVVTSPPAVTGNNPTSAGTATGSADLVGSTGPYPFNTNVVVTYVEPDLTTTTFIGMTDGAGKIRIPNLAAGVYRDFTVSLSGGAASAAAGEISLVDPGSAADMFTTITYSGSTFMPVGTIKTVTVRVSNIIQNTTTSGNITIRIFRPTTATGMSFTLNATPDWDVVTNTLYYDLTLKSGLEIASTSVVGYRQFTGVISRTGGSAGSYIFNTRINNGAGGESNNTNNTQSVTFTKL